MNIQPCTTMTSWMLVRNVEGADLVGARSFVDSHPRFGRCWSGEQWTSQTEAALKFDTHALAMQYLRQNRARMENSASEAALSHS